jgi:hypothetical protein
LLEGAGAARLGNGAIHQVRSHDRQHQAAQRAKDQSPHPTSLPCRGRGNSGAAFEPAYVRIGGAPARSTVAQQSSMLETIPTTQ